MRSSRSSKRSSGAETSTESVERFVVVEIHRSQIHNAPYNPRILSDESKKRLRKGIKKLGMLGPSCNWNEPTGNAFGGNQRLGILDALYGTKDYRLTVAKAVPPLTEIEEKEACILLNNPTAQGDWTVDGLDELLNKTPGLDLDATGFDPADIYTLFGDKAATEGNAAGLQELSERLAESKERMAKVIGSLKARDDDQFFVFLVFKNHEHRMQFLDLLAERTGYEILDNPAQSGDMVMDLLKGKPIGDGLLG